MISRILLTIALAAGLVPVSAHAEEGGRGHYFPGLTASFIDILPGRPSFSYLNVFASYNGAASAIRQLPTGGLVSQNVGTTACADTSVFVYETSKKLFGGSYAAAVYVPYFWLTVSASTQAGGVTVSRSDSDEGIGDIEILPLMVGWKNGETKSGARLGVYAPTGAYERGRLANIGRNYWTFEPGFNVSRISRKTGQEFTAFVACDFNTVNHATDYLSGDIFHIDVTVAQHLPKFGGIAGVGANLFYYRQITADSGSGARLGSFESQTSGIGPVLSYVTKTGRNKTNDLATELKWLPETNVLNRTKGDFVWFKLALVY